MASARMVAARWSTRRRPTGAIPCHLTTSILEENRGLPADRSIPGNEPAKVAD